MADSQHRERERQFDRSRSVEDETSWLQARVRAGTLSEARLLNLSRLGHPAALRLVPAPHSVWEDFGALSSMPSELLQRLVLATVKAIAPQIPSAQAPVLQSAYALESLLTDRAEDEAWDTVLDLIPGLGEELAERTHYANPGKHTVWTPIALPLSDSLRQEYAREIEPQRTHPARAVRDWLPIARSAGHPDDALGWVLDDDTPLPRLARVHLTWSVEPDPGWPSTTVFKQLDAWPEVDVLRGLSGQLSGAAAEWCALFALMPVTLRTYPHLNALTAYHLAVYVLGVPRLREAIREDVVPWLLGQGDPLQARVKARRAGA